MSAQRLHPFALVDDLDTLEVSRELGHHLGVVRRLRVGAELFVGDGAGSFRAVKVDAVQPRVHLVPLSDIQTPRRQTPSLGIAMFLPSNERLSWAVQKLTEVGIDRIHLLSDSGDRRGGVQISDAGLDRLDRIAREASQQSERLWLPDITPPMEAQEFFGDTSAGVAILDPDGGPLPTGVTTLVVGPESGVVISPESIPRVSLGLPILRIETAAVAGAVVLAALRASLICICDNS
ncbi:RsmE family RNA methyltransferase [Ferrimicrobium acidiphilum]|uniref:RsmE family RNA methyltransferase n=1 Tax=Ferrimicrobium acidiphilum TaxID=121039 RepID=UPI0023F1C7AF|nr:RsmE family RNA methyltransferase [Ferrimicrobium acidiphilum]